MNEQELAARRVIVKRQLRKEGYNLGAESRVHTGELSDLDLIALPTDTVIQMLNTINGLIDVSSGVAEVARRIIDMRQGFGE